MSHWPLAFLEFFVVLAFGVGWLILEWYCKRLDRPADAAKDARQAGEAPAPRAAE
ncbi:MAG: hypothetical protein ACT4OU_01305 [Hyphomicrobium sp.]